MCGICAIIMENNNKNFPIGCLLFKMMESQQIRAQDSTGVAIFNNGSNKEEFYKIDYFRKNNGKYNQVTEKVPKERLDKTLYELTQDPNIVIASFAKEMNLVKDIK
jgi:glucosamine 6-phosphate synthetase-like amidotransferase/phosphosugar isomerase protein